MFKGRLKNVSREFSVRSRVFESSKGFSGVFQESVSAQWMFEESFKGVSRMFPGNSKVVSRKIDW